MSRLRLAVLFGGRSSEHQISCVSAGSVLAALDRERYDVVAIGITPHGRWVLASDDPVTLLPSGRVLPSVDESGLAVVLPADPTASTLVALEPAEGTRALGGVDVVFPLLHGPYGEDGTVQGLLEMAGIPYVGSGVFASAAAMDKAHMKRMLTAAGLPVGAYTVITDREWQADPAEASWRIEELGFPVFVKPARGGSSIGISKVTAGEGIAAAVEIAREYDRKVVVETAVPGREIECGVLERLEGGAEASVPGEIRVTGGRDFYDFEAKYLDNATELTVPAGVDAHTTIRVRELAIRAFVALDCAGLARVDLFLTPSGELLVNEVNTMPGFTPVSMFPRMWEASGLAYPELVDRLISLAIARGTGLR